MNLSTILIFLLSVMILVYIYNDIVMPFIKKKLMSSTTSNTTNSTTITGNTNDTTTGNTNENTNENTHNTLEPFTQYSSLSSSASSRASPDINSTAQFDNNWYLRDSNDSNDKLLPIITNNRISLPVIRYGFYMDGAYEHMVGQYFKQHIYPITLEQLDNNLDTIYKFINNDIDIAFINEELLTRYIKKDCKYLTKLILNNLNLSIDAQTQSSTPDNIIDKIYLPINFSAIGVGFHQDMYLIVNNYSTINSFIDIKRKKIGILYDSYYYFIKLCSAYGIPSDNLLNKKSTSLATTLQTQPIADTITVNGYLEDTIEQLIEKFKSNTYDGIFIMVHPKNKQLLDLSLKMKLRFIHIQKRDMLDAKNDTSGLTVLKSAPPLDPNAQPRNLQAIYNNKDVLTTDLQSENPREDFNMLIKKYFQYITPRSVDLNKFHKSGNTYSYLETYTTRMILVIRDDIPADRVKYITQNYIDNLEKMRDTIDKTTFRAQINNLSSLEFNYNELISFDSKIPISKGSKDIYINEGLIYYSNNLQSKL